MRDFIKFRTPISLVICSVVIAACGGEPQDPAPAHRGIEAVADEYLKAMLERYPQLGTYYGIAGARHDDLFDNSPVALADWQVREDAWFAELDSIGAPADIGSRDWATYGILSEELEASIARRVCRSELWSASPMTAWYGDLPFLFDIQPLETPELREQALLRLARVAGYIDTEIDNLRMGLGLGYSAPRITVEVVPGQVRALLADDNPFVGLAGRAENEEFAPAVRKIFDEQIAPAIERFAEFIENEYLPRAREEIALSANPDGASCYPTLVRAFATVNPSADEIHNIGLEQIKGIRAEMRTLIDQHFGGGGIGAFLRNLNVDPQFTFRSEEAVLQYALDALEIVRARMPEVFRLLPKADVLIKPYPAFRATGTGEYRASSEDGARPGIFYIPVVDPEHRSRAIQQSFLYHETYPGHHLQAAIALELGDRVHPLARYLGNSGYAEGWALYSERLADEMGLYKGPLDRMGMLSDQGARAARLVIDTGLHTKGWSRQQAVDYMLDNTAWPTRDIESDIDRYISWPGQANSYMLGMLEIRRLRTLAEQALGDDFDIREFHDRVLENGNVTLPMLEAAIRNWIEIVSEAAN
jgi:uncharacterized protein (DUF885 family)